MPLKAGIVGLPNVGKSTLFNAITNSHVEAANYPFATIKPNTGVVIVPDERLDELTEMFHPERKINATFDSYWNSDEFEIYNTDAHPRLAEALKGEKWKG